MSVPARTPLGASTIVRKWYLDVNTGSIASPVWTPVRGLMSFTPNVTPTLQDDSDFDSGGYRSQAVTAIAWDASFDLSRKVNSTAPTTYDAGQEFLRTTSVTQGVQNSVQVRFYEMSPSGPRVEAYQGLASVTWSPKGGAMDAVDEVSVTLTGQGQRTAITHPDSLTPVPVIYALSPATAGVAGGAEIEIQGEYFTGATLVKVGATTVASANWQLINDGLIVFDAPAETAGTYAVTVTTPNGLSAGSNLVYS
jgi:hypothetical protein